MTDVQKLNRGVVLRVMRGLSWCLIVLTLSSCSATQFIYNRVDILVRWYLDDYVSLDRAQQARFDSRLEAVSYTHLTLPTKA